MNAASEWFSSEPAEPGTYLVEFIGDYFPKGDPNNLTHILVYVVTDEGGGELKVLKDGRFIGPETRKGWLYAKVKQATGTIHCPHGESNG